MTPEPIQSIDLTPLALPLGRDWFVVTYVGGNKVRLTAAWPDGERASLDLTVPEIHVCADMFHRDYVSTGEYADGLALWAATANAAERIVRSNLTWQWAPAVRELAKTWAPYLTPETLKAWVYDLSEWYPEQRALVAMLLTGERLDADLLGTAHWTRVAQIERAILAEEN